MEAGNTCSHDWIPYRYNETAERSEVTPPVQKIYKDYILDKLYCPKCDQFKDIDSEPVD